jgi:DNA repair exonuclease SbcCD ATPase subunit
VGEDYIRKRLPRLKERLRLAQEELQGERDTKSSLQRDRDDVDKLVEEWFENYRLADEVERQRQEFQKLKFELEQYKKQNLLLTKLERRRQKAELLVTDLTEVKKKVQRWLRVLSYGEKVFARNGLPAYLNAQIVPELNRVAGEYAERFAQKEIQVLFNVDAEGRMDVQVVNAHGGESVQDQSAGEMKMASLITSFAVRSIAPKTNILILDEPGDGLDATSARQFARGLREVVNKFGCILCVTHNPAILSELADARLVQVVKKDGISRVEG